LGLLGSLTSTPSTSTLTWLELLPRTNTEVCPPGPPVCTTFTPGTVLSASGTVRRWSRSMSAAVMTVTELATSAAGVGISVALTTISGSAIEPEGGCCASACAHHAGSRAGARMVEAKRCGRRVSRRLEHFPPKWAPVRRRKCDKRVESRAHSSSAESGDDSIRVECAPAAMIGEGMGTSGGTSVARHRERSLPSGPGGTFGSTLSAHPGRQARV